MPVQQPSSLFLLLRFVLLDLSGEVSRVLCSDVSVFPVKGGFVLDLNEETLGLRTFPIWRSEVHAYCESEELH